ncbi:MAG: hypothetical protein B6I38_08635 [Anaerolineaceae bacterium 4572_5.1]|nr:MAG: hypothetical protein B6I38_08635 [Anaerolineaceae bacterium 4572_5.1]RLD10859.1 MAG: hypothetical protein DRI56_02030 [Chloroflexota bacterium]
MKKSILFSLTILLIFAFFASTPSVAVAESEDPPVDPWVLQPWCLEHAGCGKYGLRNRTDYWLQVYLTKTDSGETGFFTVRPNDNAYITLIPGQYESTYVWWCSGEMETWTTVWPANQYWTDVFRCPGGYSNSIWRGGWED